jgi:hypothetical protein
VNTESESFDALSAVRVFSPQPAALATQNWINGIKLPNKIMRLIVNVFVLAVLISSYTVVGQAQNPSGFTPGAAPPSTSTTTTPQPRHPEDYDPLLDLPPLPKKDVTLIGGTVVSLDQVMNRMVVQPYGAKQKMQVRFDTRTRFYRDGTPVTQKDVQQGQRVYLDTMLNQDKVFAKTIWIRTSTEAGVGRGQIMAFDTQKKILVVRDELSSQPLKMSLTSSTVVRRGTQPSSLNDLKEGTLVAVSFGPQKELHEITLLASPGTVFTFAGRLTYVDLSRKLVAINNRSDNKSYDISVEAVGPNVLRQLREGVEANISAVFDGNGYSARQLTLAAPNSAPESQ